MTQTCNLILKDGGGTTGIVTSLTDNDITRIQKALSSVASLSSLVSELQTALATVKQSSGALLPIGSIVAWPVSGSPSSSWLECLGQTITSADYPDLVATITGSTTATSATIPNLQGVFLRGYGSQTVSQSNGTEVGTTATTHTSGELGKVQGDAMRQLYGTLPDGGTVGTGDAVNNALTGVFSYNASVTQAGFSSAPSKTAAQAFFSSQRTTPTATEFRPVNVAVRYFIRAL